MKIYKSRPKAGECPEGFELYPELVRDLLLSRDLRTVTEAEEFFNPDYRRLHDPFLLKGMEPATERIIGALRAGERIAVWSDYDADGGPGGVILHDFFKKIGYQNFSNYIPERHEQGFGLNAEGLEELAKEGARLIITVDCGISDVEEVSRAKELGMECIITDHHLPAEVLPAASAIINPRQKDCAYPDKNICGAAVAWKLVQAALRRLREISADSSFHPKPHLLNSIPVGWEKWLLDLVAIATLSDMVPLLGENRILAAYGLLVLRKSPRLGLVKLFERLNIRQKFITEDDVVWSLTPRLNAASRMGVSMDAFKLLSAESEEEAEHFSNELERVNNERKGAVGALTREIKKVVSERGGARGKKVIVLGNPAWRPSLLGLAANSLVAETGRPVFLWGRDGAKILRGSCRAPAGADVVSIMRSTQDVFIEFGGHALSGGFTISHEGVHVLEAELERVYSRFSQADSNAPEQFEIDKVFRVEDIDGELYGHIGKFSPFGVGNPKPLFLISGARALQIKRFGKEKNHLELVLAGESGKKISAIGFFKYSPELEEKLLGRSTVDLVGTLEKSTFGSGGLRLRIVDILF
ncbi:MAG: single-stranded-DNA-specific exonuclease RecJ [Candidatus Taylorbacteria bacterium]|nr:single-stranded-DNA-specific exonuclease RecJ [Candidatus Taylorbacteria bacterium]